MDRILFEHIVEQTFDRLPPQFKNVIENLGVVVEDYPTDDLVHKLRLRTKHDLLGLYQGIPLTARGSWYGTLPIDKIYEVLIHEIGHYFGMSEEEIRAAGY